MHIYTTGYFNTTLCLRAGAGQRQWAQSPYSGKATPVESHVRAPHGPLVLSLTLSEVPGLLSVVHCKQQKNRGQCGYSQAL